MSDTKIDRVREGWSDGEQTITGTSHQEVLAKLNEVIDAVNSLRQLSQAYSPSDKGIEPVQQSDTCSDCGGEGVVIKEVELRDKTVPTHGYSCLTCHGTGKQPETQGEREDREGLECLDTLVGNTVTVKLCCWMCEHFTCDTNANYFGCTDVEDKKHSMNIVHPYKLNCPKDFQLKKGLT